MSQLLDPNWNRATFLPYARHKQTGEGAWAVPGVLADLLSAVMLPGDVYQGNVLLIDPETGRTSDQVIRRSADLAGAMTLGAGAVPAQKNTLRAGIKAYHASPKNFDEFKYTPETRGTGDGTQSHGDGVYLAESPEVQDVYAQQFKDKYGTATKYDVEINAAIDDLLDWDAPITADSPQKIKDALNAIAKKHPELREKMFAAAKRGEKGEYYYSLLSDFARTGDLVKNQEFATNLLRSENIPGIKFMDSESRGGDAQRGTRNFVVFDPKLISIVRKYGLAGAVAAGIITQQQAQQMQEQGLI